jgi:DNA-binding transcriptional LysR family regulator
MELRNLKTFQAVADHLNLTKAAEELGYSQPTITLQIKALEKELGKPLFNRVGKRTFLTPTGRLLKQHTDKLFDVLRELEEDLKKLDNPHGTLVIAAPEFYCTYYLSVIMSSYVKHHPQVKLQLISCNSRETVKKVISNQADVGIIAGVCELPEIKNTVIDLEDFVLVTTPEILAQHEPSAALSRYPFISFKEGCNLESFISRCLAEISYTPSSVIECSSEETIKRAVLNQTGIALLSTALIEKELESGALIELHRFSQKAETSLICRKNRADEAVVQTFSELVTDVWKSVRE